MIVCSVETNRIELYLFVLLIPLMVFGGIHRARQPPLSTGLWPTSKASLCRTCVFYVNWEVFCLHTFHCSSSDLQLLRGYWTHSLHSKLELLVSLSWKSWLLHYYWHFLWHPLSWEQGYLTDIEHNSAAEFQFWHWWENAL